MASIKIIVEKHPALSDVRSAIAFHIEAFGAEATVAG